MRELMYGLHNLCHTVHMRYIQEEKPYLLKPDLLFYTCLICPLDKTALCAKSLQSCPTLCNPMDHSPPGFSVHGILQARILEGVAMPSSSKGNYLNIIKSIYEKPTANIIFNKERLIICTRVLHLLQAMNQQ